MTFCVDLRLWRFQVQPDYDLHLLFEPCSSLCARRDLHYLHVFVVLSQYAALPPFAFLCVAVLVIGSFAQYVAAAREY